MRQPGLPLRVHINRWEVKRMPKCDCGCIRTKKAAETKKRVKPKSKRTGK